MNRKNPGISLAYSGNTSFIYARIILISAAVIGGVSDIVLNKNRCFIFLYVDYFCLEKTRSVIKIFHRKIKRWL
ncbi:hypothetical protein Msip34_0369 [Methylovorus glucosotrophus SIP3-4]|uniref:Uncharacterized protein n=1 Tax=Methylovorus glucosotrophus (strain SIP3-4) TaxID=582744 RepID=C6X8Z7_METGS|nr:hypothetical protein Msip34_0369 [Methylovorus glucosotrophus SIP3-4]